MCGIAGIVKRDPGAPVDQARLTRMADAMFHRGPDADGFHLAPGAGFAFRRLAIIDRAGSNQPILNEDGQVAIVYNGEVYNFAELRAELIACGHTFKTQGDTETILHGYEQWGVRGICERARGMFVFAIHDRKHQRVVLGRDRLGIKPLHLAECADGWVFASELKSLVPELGKAPTIDPAGLIDYLTLGYVPAPRTIHRAVGKVLPGEVVTIERGTLRRERYWRPPFEVEPTDLETAADRILELLQESVRIRLIAEVPLGAFLSGGVDSSAVVAAMVREVGQQVNAVTIGFDDKECDEREAAAAVAAHLGIHPLVEEVSTDLAALDGVSDAFCEPNADPSCVPTWALCRATTKKVTVALSGDGGDELFGGYRRYAFDLLENRIRGMIPGGVRRGLVGPLGRVWPKADWLPRPLRAKTLLQNLACDPVEGYLRSVSRILPDEVVRLLDPDLLRQAGGYATLSHFRALDEQRGLSDPLVRIRALDLDTWLPDDILAKVDRASMAHSLEVRVPVLDHKMVEYATSLPSALLIEGGSVRGEQKRVFKHAVRRLIPQAILDRPKHGFDLPVAAWLRGPLAPELDLLVSVKDSPLVGMIRLDRAAQLLEEHRSGRRDRKSELWSLLMLGRWRVRHGDLGAPRRSPVEATA